MERIFENIERYALLFEKRNEKHWIVDNIIFRLYQKMVVPEGAIKRELFLNRKSGKKLLSRSKAILIRQTKTFDISSQKSEWYAIICDKFVGLEEMKSKHRNEVNRGLNNCEVKQISAKYLAENGYECYFKAFQNYKNINTNIIDEADFKKNILNSEGFEDIIHFWGVFVEKKLIAYASNYIYGNIEVAYTTIKLNPDYLKFYPSYALIYKMNEYYLKDKQFEYVNDGFKSLLHETGIQDFLIKKFGFRKAYLKLQLQYNFLFNILVKISYPLRKLICKFDNRFNALFELERINRISKK